MSVGAAAAPRGRITPRAVVLAAVVLVLGIASAGPISNYLSQRGEIDRLEQQIAELRVERQELAREIERMRDPRHLERVARECLGMVRPGEPAFADPGIPPPDMC